MAKRTNKQAPKKYTGYMKFPLCGADSQAEFRASTKYFGDFADQKKRFQIFKRPRHWRIDICLVSNAGLGEDITEISTPYNKLDKHELASLLKTHAKKFLLELNPDLVSLEQSYFKVSVL